MFATLRVRDASATAGTAARTGATRASSAAARTCACASGTGSGSATSTRACPGTTAAGSASTTAAGATTTAALCERRANGTAGQHGRRQNSQNCPTHRVSPWSLQ